MRRIVFYYIGAYLLITFAFSATYNFYEQVYFLPTILDENGLRSDRAVIMSFWGWFKYYFPGKIILFLIIPLALHYKRLISTKGVIGLVAILAVLSLIGDFVIGLLFTGFVMSFFI